MIALAFAGAILPLTAARWLTLAILAPVAAGLIIAGGAFCLEGNNHEGLSGLFCVLVPLVGLLFAFGGIVVSASRCAARSWNWRWGRMPHILLPAGLAYTVPAVVFVLID
ncbi:MAG: hypothetical protein AAF678_07220 [Pseudomonadota bacterium]